MERLTREQQTIDDLSRKYFDAKRVAICESSGDIAEDLRALFEEVNQIRQSHELPLLEPSDHLLYLWDEDNE